LSRGTPQDNKKPRLAGQGRKEADMKYIHGTWYYQGRAYESLNAALKAAWANK